MVNQIHYNRFMTSDNIADIIVSVVAFMGGAGGAKVIEAWKVRKQEAKRARLEYSLREMDEVYSAMSQVVRETPVKRFIVFRGSNGGGIPRPGHEFFASAVHERHKAEDHERMVERYKKVSVDAGYIAMLLEVISFGQKKIIVDNLEHGLLRNIYRAEGIHYAEVHFLSKTDKEVFYLSIASDEPGERFCNEIDRVEIDLAISRIRQVFRQYS